MTSDRQGPSGQSPGRQSGGVHRPRRRGAGRAPARRPTQDEDQAGITAPEVKATAASISSAAVVRDNQDHARACDWRETIDGWVRTTEIRRDAIRVLTLLLACILLALAVLTVGGQLAALWHWTISTLAGRIVGGGVAVTALAGICVKRIRRNHRALAPDDQAPASPPRDGDR